MPIVSPIPYNPLADGRQSERALLVRRGVQRMLLQMNAHVLPELSLASGRRADLIAITRNAEIWIIEIKSSVEDFRVDRKWPEYRLNSDRFFFATHPEVPASIFPEECGFILSDGYGAEVVRDALADIAHWGADHRRVRERVEAVLTELRVAALPEHRAALDL